MRWTLDLLRRQIALSSPGSPRLLLLLHRYHLILVALRLHLIPIIVDPQIFNLQLQHLDLVLQPAVLHLLFHISVICSSQFTEKLISVGLELLKADGLSWHLAAVAEVS